MATFTVDLPAHNAYVESTENLVSVIGGDGLETLASESTDSYIRFDKDESSTGGNGWAFRVGRGGSMLGFGLWDKPDAATVTDVRFVTRVRLPFGGGGTIPDGWFESSFTNGPVERWPMAMVSYAGGAYPLPGGYSFSNIPTDGQWATLECSVQLQHLISGSDYVIAGIGSPDTGTFGLCPRVFVDDHYPWPDVPFTNNVAIDMAYLAIRITYETPTSPPPLRRFPRADGLGLGPTRHYPPPESRRHAGGYK